jgi:hypothetical protein
MIRSIFETMQREMGKGRAPSRLLGGYDGGSIYKLYFCIKEKQGPLEGRQPRKDSLAELSSPSKLLRSRTKSEAIKELSSESIDKFVACILQKDFKVFEPQESAAAKDQAGSGDAFSEAVRRVSEQREPEEKKASEQIEEDVNKQTKHADQSRRRELEVAEKRLLEASLKLLKVISFLRGNRSLISE